MAVQLVDVLLQLLVSDAVSDLESLVIGHRIRILILVEILSNLRVLLAQRSVPPQQFLTVLLIVLEYLVASDKYELVFERVHPVIVLRIGLPLDEDCHGQIE